MSQSSLFSVAQAQAALAADDAVFIDTRYDLTDAQVGVRAFEKARIPGALFFDQSRVMVGQCTGKNGRHPLPQLSLFKQLLQRLQLDTGRQIIIYDADRKSTRLNSSHVAISYAVFCLKKKSNNI